MVVLCIDSFVMMAYGVRNFRHTWNKWSRLEGKYVAFDLFLLCGVLSVCENANAVLHRLLVSETELYECLQVQRRRLVKFCRLMSQGLSFYAGANILVRGCPF